jgi:predicted nucleic acid-binding protein
MNFEKTETTKSLVCVDASLGLKLVLPEKDSRRAHELWEQWVRQDRVILAPPLFLYEGASVIRGHVYRGLLTAERGDFAFQSYKAQGVSLISPSELHERAWAVAKRLNQPKVYDSYYLALAEIVDGEFWTADERLYNSTRAQYPRIRWMGHAERSG